jgi:phosphonate transport system substrate-binding protein
MIARRRLAGLAALAALSLASLGLAGCQPKASSTKGDTKEIAFSILSAESQQSMQPLWQPLLDDMSRQLGVKVKPYFATNYTALLEAMRFNQVQAGWFSALPALEATRRANAEVLGRVVDAGGEGSYTSVLIVRKGSGITLDKVLKCDKRLTLGLGDAKSTSGTLAPMAYLFTPHHIVPADCFKAVRSASHQSNAFSVANGVLNVATNNSVGLVFLARENPEMAAKVEVIWRSPPLPESSILARKDLDPAIREKMRQFFLTYGVGEGPEADRQRQVLKTLAYGGFRAADDSYLDPIREMEAAQALADARRGGDKAKIAEAQKAFDEVRLAANRRRAIDPE